MKVFVVGCTGGGTSCVAGILSRLGFYFGDAYKMHPRNSCTYEDGLVTEAVEDYLFSLDPLPHQPHRAAAYIESFFRRATVQGKKHIGYKYPNLANKPWLMQYGCPEAQVVCVLREWSSVCKSAFLHTTDPFQVIRDAASCYDNILGGRMPGSKVIVKYEEFLEDPDRSVRGLVAALNNLENHPIAPTEEMIRRACSWIDPALDHGGKDADIPA